MQTITTIGLDIAKSVFSGSRHRCGWQCCPPPSAQLQALKAQILQFDRMIAAWHRSSEASRRLDDIPGVGPVLATALVASVAKPKMFRSGRDFSAWIGLVPKQNSSGGKDRLDNISKRGDRYLRSLFTTGALAVERRRCCDNGDQLLSHDELPLGCCDNIGGRPPFARPPKSMKQ
jgi:hypothetical protein